jgi:uncharacterized protein YndB with AHSA1/START domain
VSRSPFGPGVWILGGGAVLLTIFLLIGFLLPGDWEAQASRVISGSPESVLRYVDSPEGWQEWTPWPENGVERSGPERGPGSRLSWDDPDLGIGSFTLSATGPEGVEYSVDIDEGAMLSTGAMTLTPTGDGVRVEWREQGDFGWNPLMGYWALSMGRAQSEELAKGLERLDSLVSGSAPSR